MKKLLLVVVLVVLVLNHYNKIDLPKTDWSKIDIFGQDKQSQLNIPVTPDLAVEEMHLPKEDAVSIPIRREILFYRLDKQTEEIERLIERQKTLVLLLALEAPSPSLEEDFERIDRVLIDVEDIIRSKRMVFFYIEEGELGTAEQIFAWSEEVLRSCQEVTRDLEMRYVTGNL